MVSLKPRTLKGRITLMVLLFGVVMIIVNHWWNHTQMEERRLTRLQAEATEAASPLSGILQHLLRRKQERAAELEMSYAALSPRLELGLVCDRNGVVRLSTQLQWQGLNIKDTPLAADWPRIQETLASNEAVSAWTTDKNGLVVASRFYEGYDPASRGAVVMSYDYTHELAQVRQYALHDSVTHVAVLVALCLLLWHALDELFIQRVVQMQEHFHGAATRGAHPGVLEGNDELAVISREFAKTVRQLREAEAHVLEAAEEARRKVGRELHDDLCQRITATKLKAEVVHELIQDGKGSQADLTRQLAEELAESAVIARSIARGLSPVGFETSGLEDALMDVASFINRAYGARCTVACEPVHDRLSASEQELLFRIAQELAVNAGKHSSPSSMTISTHVAADHVDLVVMHDGKPFEEKPAQARAGMGLHLLRQRLITLSATLERTVQPGPPEISITKVRIPLESTAAESISPSSSS